MNTYRHKFYAKCPENGATIGYTLEIRTHETILVERIVAAGQEAGALPKPYHENIADMMLERFGGEQRLRAFHHGVEIETTRGAL